MSRGDDYSQRHNRAGKTKKEDVMTKRQIICVGIDATQNTFLIGVTVDDKRNARGNDDLLYGG